jgi:hypothetical protein
MLMRCALFWDNTQRRMVKVEWIEDYRSTLRVIQRRMVKVEWIEDYLSTLRIIPEERRSQLRICSSYQHNTAYNQT